MPKFAGASVITPNAATAVAEVIRKAIVEGELAAGERLKEDELARELNVSRTPIREALLLLQADGLVQAVPRRGAVVRSYGVKELAEMYELRALLEGCAAKKAARRMTDEQVEELRKSCERFTAIAQRHDADVRELVKENMFFHDAIHEATDSPRLVEMVRSVIDMPLVYKAYIWYSPKQKLLSEHYHNELTAAMANHDAERAELIMKEHVYEARDHLLATLEAEAAKHGADSDAAMVLPQPDAQVA
jgi:DNA-binding GntR family transcriptional regulator